MAIEQQLELPFPPDIAALLRPILEWADYGAGQGHAIMTADGMIGLDEAMVNLFDALGLDADSYSVGAIVKRLSLMLPR